MITAMGVTEPIQKLGDESDTSILSPNTISIYFTTICKITNTLTHSTHYSTLGNTINDLFLSSNQQ